MEFDVKLDYTIDDIQAYWKGFVQKKAGQKPPEKVSLKQMIWTGLFFLAAGLLTAVVMKSAVMSMLEMVLGIFLLAASRRVSAPQSSAYSRWTRQTWKKYQETGPMYNCCFTEDGVWVHDCKSDHRYNYEFLEALWEDPDRFYLELPGNQGLYVLNKVRFTSGDPADLPAFWEVQTGKPVKQMQ